MQLQKTLSKYPLALPHYRLIDTLHESENAVIFLAEHADGIQVAIKRFKFDVSQLEDTLINTFILEARALGVIAHRGVVRLLDAGVDAGALYLIMEYIPGETLRRLLTLTPHIPLSQALHWFEEITLALQHIHSIGLLHQDLKTANILLRPDKSLALLDFGLETRLLIAASFIRDDEIYCTPYYVSPERILGDPPDERADLYALGVILYELLVGHKPYEANSLAELLKKHSIAPIPQLPPKLQAYQPLLNGLLAKFPENRLQSATEVVRLLHEIQLQRA